MAGYFTFPSSFPLGRLLNHFFCCVILNVRCLNMNVHVTALMIIYEFKALSQFFSISLFKDSEVI